MNGLQLLKCVLLRLNKANWSASYLFGYLINWFYLSKLVALRIFLVECRLETSIVSEVHFHNKYAVCVFIWIIYLFSLLYFSSAESLRYQANNCPICRSRKYEMHRAWNWLIFFNFCWSQRMLAIVWFSQRKANTYSRFKRPEMDLEQGWC